MLRTEGTYYARSEHGGHQVRADGQGFLVGWPNGAVRYPSARQTIIALVNQEPTPQPYLRDPKVTFNRYFRQGRYRPPEPTLDTLTLFQLSPDLTVAVPRKPKVRTSTVLSVVPTPLGVDLERRSHEVRKLFFAGYGRRVLQQGYDPEDVLQEIYKGLLVRNQGKCPFDPAKSSFGHYVHMVCGCIVSNYHRRYSRLRRNESFGTLGPEENELQDVAASDLAVVEAEQEDMMVFTSATGSLLIRVGERAVEEGLDMMFATECANYMLKGYRKSEIAVKTGVSPTRVAKTLRLIRSVAHSWRADAGF